MENLILFGATFLIVFILSYFFTVRKTLKKGDMNLLPPELQILKNYKVDFAKTGLKKPLYYTAFANSTIVSLAILAGSLVEKLTFKIGIAFVVIIPSILIIYKLISIILMKGKTKNV